MMLIQSKVSGKTISLKHDSEQQKYVVAVIGGGFSFYPFDDKAQAIAKYHETVTKFLF